MPTDLSVPRWRCDICGTEWTGQKAHDAAAACEATGVADPLPTDTWFLSNGYAANWDQWTTGGFRLTRVGEHRIKRDFTGSGHRVFYSGGAHETRDDNLHPHRPGVLNVLDSTGYPSLHEDRLETVLREPEAAAELVQLLATFGVHTTEVMVQGAASAAYTTFDFGIRSSLDGKPTTLPYASVLPALSSLDPAIQNALRTVATGTDYGTYDHSRHYGRPDGSGLAQTAMTLMLAEHANTNRARAQALTTNHLDYLTDVQARWWAGEDVSISPSMLTATGGRPFSDKRHAETVITIEQRDALRAAGLTVPWPVKMRATDSINTPERALKAVLSLIPTLEVPMNEQAKLFDVAQMTAVVSGKGGVGKSTVASALAMSLTAAGQNTLVIDLDFHGPSLGTLLDLPDLSVSDEGKIVPTTLADGTKAISLAQFLGANDAVTWRGPSVEGFLLFLGARLDLSGIEHIVFDLPPGTGDIERAVFKYTKPTGVVLVTTGSDLSHADCRRAGRFVQNHHVPILGVVENLSRRDVTLADGSVVEGRLFGTEQATKDFVASLEHHTGWRQRYAPAYLGSLPFEADPVVLAATAEFTAVRDAAIASEPEAEDPNAITSKKITLSMTMGD